MSDRRGGTDSIEDRLKYIFHGTINAKNLKQHSFSPSDGKLACSDRGTYTFQWWPSPGATTGTYTPLFKTLV